jgi:hypothetical protein
VLSFHPDYTGSAHVAPPEPSVPDSHWIGHIGLACKADRLAALVASDRAALWLSFAIHPPITAGEEFHLALNRYVATSIASLRYHVGVK